MKIETLIKNAALDNIAMDDITGGCLIISQPTRIKVKLKKRYRFTKPLFVKPRLLPDSIIKSLGGFGV